MGLAELPTTNPRRIEYARLSVPASLALIRGGNASRKTELFAAFLLRRS
jgi:hypothetical protein